VIEHSRSRSVHCFARSFASCILFASSDNGSFGGHLSPFVYRPPSLVLTETQKNILTHAKGNMTNHRR
jgi:hypothetical protein